MNRIALALCAALIALNCNAGDSTTLGALPTVNPRIVTEGSPCSGAGLQGMNAAGLILSCQSGAWKANTASLDGPYLFSHNGYLGQFTICTLAYTSPQKKQLTYSAGGWYASIDSTNRVYCWR